FSLTIRNAIADPAGATVSYQFNTTSNGTGPGSRQDQGGYIYTVNLNTIQQNSNWKAYVGNITGALTLDDASNSTIFNWEISVTQGEILVSRNSSLNFGQLKCVNATVVASENTFFGYNTISSDNVNGTFNATNHSTIQIGTTTITQDTCPSQALWVNDTKQTPTNIALWQEVLLGDDADHLIYMAKINNDEYAFNNITHDFQLIVAENGTSSTPTTYYFFAEIV
ncbi:MAG: hypothetical protein ABIH41_04425, partial [Nanoarchaeota archaeon]